MQYSYVNRRFVRERTLSHAVADAYEGLLPARRRPVWFLFLSLDPAEVDVNVHPTKIEVRLRRPREVHARILSATRQALRHARFIPQVQLSPPEGAEESARKDSIRSAIADFFAGQPASTGEAPQHEASPWGRAMQVHDAYIVEEVPEGIRLIDQHALHERILYEALRGRLASGPLTSQRLLVPELVDLAPAEMEAVLELKGDLARLGLELEPFGLGTVIVRAFPQLLGRFDGPGFLREVLQALQGPEGARGAQDRIEKLLKVMACHGAVKAGERLSAAQVRALLEQRPAQGADTCPHGRPTGILVSRSELERQFRRT